MNSLDARLSPIDTAPGPPLPPDINFPPLVPSYLPGQPERATQRPRVAHGSPPPASKVLPLLSPPPLRVHDYTLYLEQCVYMAKTLEKHLSK